MNKTNYEIEWINNNIWHPSSDWLDIETAPKNGSIIELLIPYNKKTFSEKECINKGYWDDKEILYGLSDSEKSVIILQKGCWRFNKDDGPFGIQPLFWRNNE